MAVWKITIISLLLASYGCMECTAIEPNDWTDDCALPCRCKWVSGRKTADCSNSKLTQLPDKLSTEVQWADFSSNKISGLRNDDFTRIGLANLQKIYLKDCQIKEVHKDAFRGLKILIELDLSNNQIHVVHAETFKDNERLRVLSLSANPIEKLEDGLFSNHVYLQTVELSDCSISRIGHKTFTNVPVLSTLKLDGNQLTHLKVTTFESLKKLSSLEIRNNPWICDCNLRSFRDWIIERNLYTLPTACKEPPRLQDQLWTNILSNQFACKPNIIWPKSGAEVHVNSDSVNLGCRVLGDPKPERHWVFRSRIIENNTFSFSASSSSGSKYSLKESQDGSWLNLTIARVGAQDEGDYSCVATSPGGIDEKNVSVTSRGKSTILDFGEKEMTGDVWLLLLCLIVGILCALMLLIVLCCICCRRHDPSSKKSQLNSITCSNGDATYSSRVAPDQRKTLLTTINPIQKPPRKYEESPTPETMGTELTELNRNLLDDGSVLGSSSVAGESLDERRSSDSTDRLSSRHSQYTYLTPEKSKSESASNPYQPPDLLSFPSRATNATASLAGSYTSNDLKSVGPTGTGSRLILNSPLHSPIYTSSYGTLPYNRSQSPFSSNPGAAAPLILTHRQGYVTIPRRPRIPSWSSAPTPTLLEDSLARAEPVYDNLGPRTTADGSSVLSLPRTLAGESLVNTSGRASKIRPAPHTQPYGNGGKLNANLVDVQPLSTASMTDNKPVVELNNNDGVIKPLPLNETQLLLPVSVKNENGKRKSSWANNSKGVPESGILKRPTSNGVSINSTAGTGTTKPKVPPKPPPRPKKEGPLFEDEGEDGTEV